MENITLANLDEETLNKSLDALIDAHFAEPLEKATTVGDAPTKADAAVNAAPKFQDDASRGAGRPKQISDVPSTDTDGKREGDYDGSITEAGKEDESEEVKKQIKAIDQNSNAGHGGSASAAPKSAPFKKAQDDVELEEFRAWKAERLQKSQLQDQEQLIKGAIAAAVEPLQKALADLQEVNATQAAMIRGIAKAPVRSQSISGIDQLNKSLDPNTRTQPETFTKSQMLDAAENLVKSRQITTNDLIELENTGTIYNPESRRLIELELQKIHNP